MAEGGTTLEYTPTWVVAVVCIVIVSISLTVERILHYLGKLFKRKEQKPLYDALLKIKEELMLLGFISLLLTVFQGRINSMCISQHLANTWLPCKKESENTDVVAHFQSFFSFNSGGGGGGHSSHRLLAEEGSKNNCPHGKVPILSTTALHHLHIFIFVLACVHVVVCAFTILFGTAKINLWKSWEDTKEDDLESGSKFTHVHDHDFIKKRFKGLGKRSYVWGWVHAFFKQFYGSVTKSDYTTLRLGFIMTHFRGNPKFDFHRYMMRALESDFKKVVGISWFLWLFVVVFLLVNVHGWHAYFYISFIPFILLLAVGAKLEHVITKLAHEVAAKHVAVEGDLVVQPSDSLFWFNQPKFVLCLIHVILFQNSFELAYFFWILVQYGFHSCIMGRMGYVIPRLVIGVFVQFVCSFSTLPLYALVTQMGSSFQKVIFDEHIQEGLVGWAKQAKKNVGLRKGVISSSPPAEQSQEVNGAIRLARIVPKEQGEIVHETDSD